MAHSGSPAMSDQSPLCGGKADIEKNDAYFNCLMHAKS